MTGYLPLYSFKADEYMIDTSDVRFASATRWCNTSGPQDQNNCIVDGSKSEDYFLTTTKKHSTRTTITLGIPQYPKKFGGRQCITTDNKAVENNFVANNNKCLTDMTRAGIETNNLMYQNKDVRGVMYNI